MAEPLPADFGEKLLLELGTFKTFLEVFADKCGCSYEQAADGFLGVLIAGALVRGATVDDIHTLATMLDAQEKSAGL